MAGEGAPHFAPPASVYLLVLPCRVNGVCGPCRRSSPSWKSPPLGAQPAGVRAPVGPPWSALVGAKVEWGPSPCSPFHAVPVGSRQLCAPKLSEDSHETGLCAQDKRAGRCPFLRPWPIPAFSPCMAKKIPRQLPVYPPGLRGPRHPPQPFDEVKG